MDAPALDGRVALITGATSGIGFCTATALASAGASVYITGRDARRGETAERELRAAAGHERVAFLECDASTVGANQALGQQLLESLDRLDILVNNVGGAYNDREVTADGYEASLAMNFVGPSSLTATLLPLVQRTNDARIVNVVSEAYRMCRSDPFSDLDSAEAYLGSGAYARAKLLNVLWTFALARRLNGSGVVACAADPGTAWTPMTQGIARRSMPLVLRIAWPLVRALQRSGTAEGGARSSIFAATSVDGALNGAYLDKRCHRVPIRTSFGDELFQEKAWVLAASLVAAAPTAVSASGKD